MICPRWLHTRAQPIAVRNVLDDLVAALDTPENVGLVIEVPSPNRWSCRVRHRWLGKPCGACAWICHRRSGLIRARFFNGIAGR